MFILETYENATVDQDGYLAIDAVSLSENKMELRVTGTPTSFIFLFAEADISVVPIISSGRDLCL